METELAMEEIRERVLLLTKSIEELDNLTNHVIEARWRFEMLSRLPRLGRTPNGKMIEAKDMVENIARLEAERDAATDIVVSLTGAANVNDARDMYIGIMASFQRQASLRETRALFNAGIPEVRKSVEEEYADVTNLNAMIGRVQGDVTALVQALPELPNAADSVEPEGVISLHSR